MTAPATTQPAPTVRPTGAGTLLVGYLHRPGLLGAGEVLELPWDQAYDLATALLHAAFAQAPELTRVLGYDNGGGLTVVPADTAGVYAAEGWELTHGLACPHPGCGHVAWDGYDSGVYVVDGDERWSVFGYERSTDRTGQLAEAVVGGYEGETNYEGLGYRCEGCSNLVSLPEGVTEEGQ